jgi:hypothetical protein
VVRLVELLVVIVEQLSVPQLAFTQSEPVNEWYNVTSGRNAEDLLMEPGTVETELISGFLGTFLLVIVCAWTLYNRDSESRKLLEMEKLWRPPKASESNRLATLKRRMVIGFSIFLGLNTAMCLFFAFEILRSRFF